MTKTTDAKIVDFDGTDFTEICFYPDLEKFKMEMLDRDIVALLTRRAYDIAGCTKGVRVTLNGTRLSVSFSNFNIVSSQTHAIFRTTHFGAFSWI